jgi:secreted Zn-dependent insulinase-like peptidase
MLAFKNEAFYSELLFQLEEAETEERIKELEEVALKEFSSREDSIWLDRFFWEAMIRRTMIEGE